MITKCPYLINATKLAHQRGLLPKKEILKCEFEGNCDQVDCLKLENPSFKPIFIKQGEVGGEFSPETEFYVRAKKSLRIIRERG